MTILKLLYGATLALLLRSARGNLADDSVLFSINWPGSSPDKKLAPAELETLWMVSAEKERYQCLLPANPLSREDADAASPYTGPTPLELLKPLFSRLFCSYRLEQYWTYELCHGKSVRQYHEESIDNKVVLQQYYLGKYDAKKLEVDDASYLSEKSRRPPRIRLEAGLELPYFAVNMTGGTACELGEGAQRATRVLYVCNPEARNEVLSIEELSTCEYQAVVFTPYLCAHPDYSPETSPENPIQCVAQDGAPRRPKGLGTEQVQLLPPEPLAPQPPPSADKLSQLVKDFLAGSHCLTGGAGWWKYEFCYGQRVSQFHEEKGKERTSILLGIWDHQAHLTWLDQHPERKPGRTPRYLTHFYGSGDTCDLTGKPRTVEVLLKCRQAKGNLDSVSLYLLEPRTCEYILGVESAIVCSLLEKVDEYGLPS
ncbi:endoplasmic reticulum lectin 1 [Dermacentor andersoni]|uniref:endoplasmic reticulum lectin 1 n=1 Tax=Dermacentor andersoni TaxID=34620 RepID=UPI0021558E29|nr:endoplasmic reticulum lectin 1-like [Dermacentor andersoni]